MSSISIQSLLTVLLTCSIATQTAAQGPEKSTQVALKPTSEITLDGIVRVPMEEGSEGFDRISGALLHLYDFDASNPEHLRYGRERIVELSDGYLVTGFYSSDPHEYFRLSIAPTPCLTTERAGLLVGAHKAIAGIHGEAMYFMTTRGAQVDFDAPSPDYSCITAIGVRKITALRSQPGRNPASPSIENFLKLPLTEGKYGYLKVVESIRRLYAFDESTNLSTQANLSPVQIGDGFNLKSATIYNATNRVTIDVSGEPCYPINQAIHVTNAKEGPPNPREYRDVRAYRAKSMQTTVDIAASYPDQKCLAAISISASPSTIKFP